MPRRIQRYDHPNYVIRREVSALGAAATGGTNAQYMPYQKIRLVAAHFRVVTAGTAAGNAFTIRSGTNSLGTVVLSTATAGVTTSVPIRQNIASLEVLNALKGAEATGVAQITWEFEVLPDAVQSV